MVIEEWNVSEELKQELAEHYKTKFALSLKHAEPMEVAKALTFDGLTDSITKDDLLKFLTFLDQHLLKGGFCGQGLEIGSGPGTFVGTFARMPRVEKVYGIEACEAILRVLMTKVVTDIAGDATEKVIGVVGDFDRLKIEDKSLDFIFDFFSLHHSPDPAITIRELGRVLKDGGVLVCVDKARADVLSDSDLEALLDVEYPPESKIQMGLPPAVRHTRRMNGEQEYRLRDWKSYFKEAGFSKFTHYNVAKIGGRKSIRYVKKMVALLPIRLQAKVTRLFSRRITNNLEPKGRIFADVFPEYPKEFSLMIVYK